MCSGYPSIIQPQTNYRKRMDFQAMQKAYPSLVAVRLSEVSHAEAFEDSISDGRLVLHYKALVSVIGMSMNLLGGLFDKDRHLYFRPTKDSPCYEDWDGESTYEVKDGGYQMMPDDRFPLFYNLIEWDTYTFPYHVTAKSEQDFIDKTDCMRKIAEETGVEQTLCKDFPGKSKPFEVMARARINHHPTLMNYWHYQLDCYSADSKEAITNDTKPGSLVKKLSMRLRNELKVRYQESVAELNYTISPQYYRI